MERENPFTHWPNIGSRELECVIASPIVRRGWWPDDPEEPDECEAPADGLLTPATTGPDAGLTEYLSGRALLTRRDEVASFSANGQTRPSRSLEVVLRATSDRLRSEWRERREANARSGFGGLGAGPTLQGERRREEHDVNARAFERLAGREPNAILGYMEPSMNADGGESWFMECLLPTSVFHALVNDVLVGRCFELAVRMSFPCGFLSGGWSAEDPALHGVFEGQAYGWVAAVAWSSAVPDAPPNLGTEEG